MPFNPTNEDQDRLIFRLREKTSGKILAYRRIKSLVEDVLTFIYQKNSKFMVRSDRFCFYMAIKAALIITEDQITDEEMDANTAWAKIASDNLEPELIETADKIVPYLIAQFSKTK